MKYMYKKGYVRTIEAVIAFFITFLFLVLIVFKGIPIKEDNTYLGVLPALEQRDDFRTCVYQENSTCVELLADSFIPATYSFKVSIGPAAPFTSSKDIYTETLYVVSNVTGRYKIVYLYYWPLSG